MNESRKMGPDGEEKKARRIHLARLEADVAYFQARLEMLGDPRTTNQQAQRKAFKLLCKTLGDAIVQIRRRMIRDG